MNDLVFKGDAGEYPVQRERNEHEAIVPTAQPSADTLVRVGVSTRQRD
jgi:hypothetical protein